MRCRDETGVDLSKEARSAADLAGVAFGAGGALLAGSLVLFLTAPSGDPARGNGTTSGAFRFAPLIGPDAGGFTMGGRF